MSDARSLTRHGQDRKAELLRHAEYLFAKRGYENTRMVDIADAAGVAKGLVYWYFENKETLFREIVADMGRRLRRALSRAVDGVDDPLGRLYVATAESVRFIGENHRLYGIISIAMRGDQRLRDTRSHSRRVLADDAITLLAEGQEIGQVRTDEDPAVLAHANAGVVYYFVLLYADGVTGDGRRRLELEAAAHGAARYVVRAVAASDAVVEAVVSRHAPSHAQTN